MHTSSSIHTCVLHVEQIHGQRYIHNYIMITYIGVHADKYTVLIARHTYFEFSVFCDSHTFTFANGATEEYLDKEIGVR